jgi:hypothetical protein
MPLTTIEKWIRELDHRIAQRDEIGIVQHLMDLVPEFTPDDKWRRHLPVTERSAAMSA